MSNRCPVNIKVVCVGVSGVGKTSQLIRFTSNQFAQDYVPTYFDQVTATICINGKTIYADLNDTGAHDSYYARLRVLQYRDADVILLHFPCNDIEELYNCENSIYPEIQRYCPTIPVILVATKSDQGMPESVKTEMLAVSKRLSFCAGCFLTSALNGDGVTELFHAAAMISIGQSKKVKKYLNNRTPDLVFNWMLNMNWHSPYIYDDRWGLEYVDEDSYRYRINNWENIEIVSNRKTKQVGLNHICLATKNSPKKICFGSNDVIVIPFQLNDFKDIAWVDDVIDMYELDGSNAKRPIIFCGFCASEWDQSSQIHPEIQRNFERSIHDGCISLGMDTFVRDMILSFIGNDLSGSGIHEKILEEWDKKCDALAVVTNESDAIDNIQGFQDALSKMRVEKSSQVWWPSDAFKDDKRHIKYVVCNIL